MTTGAGMDAKGGGSSSGGGGQFLKGSGESQLESDRRLFRKQISKIEAEMDEVGRRLRTPHAASRALNCPLNLFSSSLLAPLEFYLSISLPTLPSRPLQISVPRPLL
eukprot:901101-Pleurochrysis_carterae.AAC.1